MSLINPLTGAGALLSRSASQAISESSSGSPYLDSLRGSPEVATGADQNKELSQEDFFALLSQQLSMQDPFKPVGNDQMIAQMASFSTVDGIASLNDEIVNLNSVMTSSQALQASGLVGQKVLIPSGSANLAAEEPSVRAVVTTPVPAEAIRVRVEDENGQLITTFDVNGQAGGNIDFSWDGLNSRGEAMPPGNYSFRASARVDGEVQELPVSTYAHVTSVSLGTATSGAVLNLRGIGGVKLADVLAVAES
ncbi:basal-body rod modification protein FlgD [Shewanella sp. NFH-SH190041]|uniref:flagellar hook assembly protein FlgD n=1 Tax=Shewanella sp. NFH-SH190041 TaxID=2950245 RepID=UPI0021C313BA|nr:flagellar hook assembly protein FlgD [Shewanella sp. NFH-SH190041]BDM63781.1 basal-body rod modification protein FlgD [Shewanella sp. NFH-SH190041]